MTSCRGKSGTILVTKENPLIVQQHTPHRRVVVEIDCGVMRHHANLTMDTAWIGMLAQVPLSRAAAEVTVTGVPKRDAAAKSTERQRERDVSCARSHLDFHCSMQPTKFICLNLACLLTPLHCWGGGSFRILGQVPGPYNWWTTSREQGGEEKTVQPLGSVTRIGKVLYRHFQGNI